MTRLIGLTGGLATGKSLVCEYFKALGVPVLEADKVARTLTEPHTPVFDQIIVHFGPDFVTPQGRLDRARLRKHIFQNPVDKIWLEKLLHPLILDRLWTEAKTLSTPYVVLDIPLLF
jgi:dephospho-CoA kinase